MTEVITVTSVDETLRVLHRFILENRNTFSAMAINLEATGWQINVSKVNASLDPDYIVSALAMDSIIQDLTARHFLTTSRKVSALRMVNTESIVRYFTQLKAKQEESARIEAEKIRDLQIARKRHRDIVILTIATIVAMIVAACIPIYLHYDRNTPAKVTLDKNAGLGTPATQPTTQP